MKRGYVQIYTGCGKGKTTAAAGLAARAAASGLRVWFGQLMKKGYAGELEAFARVGGIDAFQFGVGDELHDPDREADAAAARRGLEAARKAMRDEAYDLVVLDEGNVAASLGYLEEGALLDLIACKPEGVELVITGRGASEEVMQAADLVTEMREAKHYFARGVAARRGIEA